MNATSSSSPQNSDFAPSPAFSDQFALLRRTYGDRLDEKIGGIEASWQHYLTLPAGEEKFEALTALHRLTHSLAGSGATFGFPLVSQFARRCEMVFKEIVSCAAHFNDTRNATTRDAATGDVAAWEQSQTPAYEQRIEIEAALEGLRAAVLERAQTEASLTLEQSAGLESVAAFGGAARASIAPDVRQLLPGEIAADASLAPSANALIYMFCESSHDVPTWAASVETFGYRLQIFSDAHQLRAAAAREMPAALIVSSASEPIQVGERGEPLGSVLHELKEQGDHQIPVIWVCDNGDLRARLQAVRLGAAAFFTHPVDVDALLVKLDDLTALHTPEPFRVLIVDDEPALARLYSLILRQAGIETREVTDPMEVMAPLVDFRPDLILMDVYMPGCNGSEIAAVIRQQEAYVGIPIMFLSSESDTGKQLEAMRLGGDEFLQKPVQPRYLVSSVWTRATRARVLQNLMIRDSLTGLLNHTKTKEQLNIEIERMRRLGHEVSLAMIDIDYFKKVNDTYGHATGDRVLRSLSRLLSQRMRQTDIVGRYGGEEFAVIMIGASAENARRAIDKVRQSWEQLPHFSNGREFYSTFSAGVACAPPHQNAAFVSESADAALYQAKHAGRNQVVLGE